MNVRACCSTRRKDNTHFLFCTETQEEAKKALKLSKLLEPSVTSNKKKEKKTFFSFARHHYRGHGCKSFYNAITVHCHSSSVVVCRPLPSAVCCCPLQWSFVIVHHSFVHHRLSQFCASPSVTISSIIFCQSSIQCSSKFRPMSVIKLSNVRHSSVRCL